MTLPLDKDVLADLLGRVTAAEKCDRVLDGDIATGLGLYVREKRDRDRMEWFYPTDLDVGRRDLRVNGHDALSRYTASIDAAVALVERMLPGWEWNAALYSGTIGQACLRKPGDDEPEPLCFAPTPALAILAALLKTLSLPATAMQEADRAEKT